MRLHYPDTVDFERPTTGPELIHVKSTRSKEESFSYSEYSLVSRKASPENPMMLMAYGVVCWNSNDE